MQSAATPTDNRSPSPRHTVMGALSLMAFKVQKMLKGCAPSARTGPATPSTGRAAAVLVGKPRQSRRGSYQYEYSSTERGHMHVTGRVLVTVLQILVLCMHGSASARDHLGRLSARSMKAMSNPLIGSCLNRTIVKASPGLLTSTSPSSSSHPNADSHETDRVCPMPSSC